MDNGGVLSGCGAALGTVGLGSFTFPQLQMPSSPNQYLLFEGSGIGSGELVLTISQNSQVLAETSAWIELRDVRDLYERVIITNSTSGAISNWSSGIHAVELPFATAASEDENVILYVHGASNNEASWRVRSETAFKRLYLSGFQGRFASARWPSVIETEFAWFNWSELHSYKAANGLRAYLNQLQTRLPGYGLHIFAHSQGGAISSEALSQGAPFDTLILSQVAMAASCYDESAPTNSDLLAREAVVPTPDWQPMGYRGAHTNINGRIVNFFNVDDSVLSVWLTNQKLAKPTQFYSFDGTNCWYLYDSDLGLYRQVTDPQESRAHIARSRTLSIGAQGPLQGQTTQGVVESAIDLKTQLGIGTSSEEHSAFFTRPVQTCGPFFDQILESCLIPTMHP